VTRIGVKKGLSHDLPCRPPSHSMPDVEMAPRPNLELPAYLQIPLVLPVVPAETVCGGGKGVQDNDRGGARMRQIPSEEKYCGDCPCAAMNADFCFLYQESTEPVRGHRDELRLPICLRERPMIVSRGSLAVPQLDAENP
jgi:hypothetical protein